MYGYKRQAAPDVTVGTASGLPGARVNVPLSFVNSTVADATFTVTYDPALLTPVNLDPTPEETTVTPAIYHSPGSALTGETNSSTISGSSVQLTIGSSGGILPDGVLAIVPFTINSLAAHGTTNLTIAAVYSDASAASVAPDALNNGKVSITSFPLAAIQMLLLGRISVPYLYSDTPLAVPATIVPGGASVLSWNFANADTVTIDQGIGAVNTSGLLAVSPTETTTYHITATGLGGTTTISVTVTVITDNPLSLQITGPIAESLLNRQDILVQGTFTNTDGNETGITVNGVVALVSGDQFVANHVPLSGGANIITAVATDTAGNTTGTSEIVYSDVTGEYVELSTDTEIGVSPLEATLTVDGSFAISDIPVSLTYSGPGTVEVLAHTGNTYRLKMTTPGLYMFLTEVEYQGATYADVVAVQVLDSAALDALLKGKWEAMKAAMVAGDVEGAVKQFTMGQQSVFREVFTLALGNISQMASAMQEIEMVYQKNDTAEYRINRDVIFNGTPETITFYIYFQREGDGIWRIRDF